MEDPTPFTVAQPRPSDWADLARIHVQAWRETYSSLLPARFFGDEALRKREDMWRSSLSHPDAAERIRVARVDGRPVGFAIHGPSRDTPPVRPLELFTLYVLAAHHGTGAGQALLDSAIGDAPASLWVAESNPRARRFYARNGFARDGAHRVEDDLEDLAEVRLVR